MKMVKSFAAAVYFILAASMIMVPPVTAQQRRVRVNDKKLVLPKRTRKGDGGGGPFTIVLSLTVNTIDFAQSNAPQLGVILRYENQEYYAEFPGPFGNGSTKTLTLPAVPFKDIDSVQLFTVSTDGLNLVGGSVQTIGEDDEPIPPKLKASGFEDRDGIWLDQKKGSPPVPGLVENRPDNGGPYSTCWEVSPDIGAKLCSRTFPWSRV